MIVIKKSDITSWLVSASKRKRWIKVVKTTPHNAGPREFTDGLLTKDYDSAIAHIYRGTSNEYESMAGGIDPSPEQEAFITTKTP